MKKIGVLLLSLVMIISFSTPALAADIENEIDYFADGSYIISTIEDEDYDITPFSTTTTKSKTATYYSASGISAWSVKVTGTFTYGNGTSKCTKSSVTTHVYTDNWRIVSKSASKSNNKASATASAIQSLNGKDLPKITKTVTLTCSATGKFS